MHIEIQELQLYKEEEEEEEDMGKFGYIISMHL